VGRICPATLATAGTTCALLLAFGSIASAHASPAACDTREVESLIPQVSEPPRGTLAGKVAGVDVTVVRGHGAVALPAEGVRVLVWLTGTDWGVYKVVVTNAKGTAQARLAVPRTARGPAEIAVDASRELVVVPCADVQEHGSVVRPWGRGR
jgi:hypothetical protein